MSASIANMNLTILVGKSQGFYFENLVLSLGNFTASASAMNTPEGNVEYQIGNCIVSRIYLFIIYTHN